MRKDRIYVLGNANTLLTFDRNKILSNDLVVMFNEPRRNDIQPNILFVANTIHPAKKFLRSHYCCKELITNKKIELIFPYSTDTINQIPTLEKSNKLLDRLRGWNSNGANKICKKIMNKHQFISLENYKNLCAKLSINYEKFIPSTGIIAIDYCLNYFDLTRFDIYLVGFTFQGSPCHDFAKEKKFIDDLTHQHIVYTELEI